MSKAWITAKLPEFARDMLRDYSLAVQILERQFRIFDGGGQVEFEALRDLLGEHMNKGLLWRLKDTAHHLFRNEQKERLDGLFLDWCIGYIFHETMKLKEDSYQQQNYSPWFRDLQGENLPEAESAISLELLQVLSQTNESIRREIDRIRFILSKCASLMPMYFRDQRENALLARFLFEQNELVRGVFGAAYEELIRAIYDDAPEMMLVMAARSLRQGGWMRHASQAVDEALALSPDSALALAEKEILGTWRKGLKV
ncbi:MAG: hypothetical protein HQK81_03125 [Desulfovibrionaceae bacterium]|nr:hypothetical protein [Desulfovibrionaceae bacterium]MBF0513038.1 hypothetical protein [Desulfovibrionaceae bacterium]